MRKFIPYTLILVLIIGIFTPVFVHAQVASMLIGAIGGTAIGTILNLVTFAIKTLVEAILGLSGFLLNYAIDATVVKMSATITALTGINTAWKVIRDLMNMVFIFLLVYEAIKMIIGQKTNIKQFVSGIALASILINFSLFFTKLMIDASNIVTVGIYNSLMGGATATSIWTTGLSNSFMGAIGLQGFNSGLNSLVVDNLLGQTSIGFNIIASILMIVLAFVFFAIAVLFIVRYAILLILLILSPVGFMGLALPGIKKHASNWWASLNGQLLFAPIFMIMMWVILTLLADKSFAGDVTQWSYIGGADAKLSIPLLFNYGIILSLMIAALVIAKSFASQGHAQISKLVNKATGYAGSAVFGSAAYASRQTVGRAGNAIANNETLKGAAAKGGILGLGAKTIIKTGDKTAKSSFDVRSSSSLGGLTKAAGFGKGADAKKVNFQKELEAKAKAEQDFAKKLKPSDAVIEEHKEVGAVKAGYEGYEDLEKKTKTTKATQDEAEKELKKLNEDKKKVEEKLVNPLPGTEQMYKEQKFNIERDIERKNTELETLKTLNKKAVDTKKNVDDAAKKIFTDRVEAYAKTFEEESRWWQNTKNVIKFPLGLVTSTSPTTKPESNDIARAIRKASKDKTPDEKIAEAAAEKTKQAAKERREAGLPPEDGEEEKPKEESEKKPEEEGETTT